MIIRLFNDSLVREFMNSVPYEEYVPESLNLCKKTIVLGWFEMNQLMGCFLFMKSGKEFECHACIKADARGKRAVIAGKKAIQWVFDRTKCRAIFAEITQKNVGFYAAMCGMKRVGSRYEVLKDGRIS